LRLSFRERFLFIPVALSVIFPVETLLFAHFLNSPIRSGYFPNGIADLLQLPLVR